MTLLVTIFLVLINIFNNVTSNSPNVEGLTAISSKLNPIIQQRCSSFKVRYIRKPITGFLALQVHTRTLKHLNGQGLWDTIKRTTHIHIEPSINISSNLYIPFNHFIEPTEYFLCYIHPYIYHLQSMYLISFYLSISMSHYQYM